MRVPKVLIVASNPFSLGLMSDLLAANNVTALRENSADGAVHAAREHRPTMVILDLDLPQRETSVMMQSFKSDPSLRELPLMSVADQGQREAAQSIIDGFDAHVEKPIDTGAFPRVVVREIRRHTTSVARQVEI